MILGLSYGKKTSELLGQPNYHQRSYYTIIIKYSSVWDSAFFHKRILLDLHNNCFKDLTGQSLVYEVLYTALGGLKEACFRNQTDIQTASQPYASADATSRQYLRTQCAPDALQTAVQPAGMIWGSGSTSGLYCCTAGHQIALRRHPP